MRLAGRITDWNDDKGFGFVVPNGGGDRAFVHISELQRGSRRLAAGDLISYMPGKDTRGRLQARDIRHAGERIQPQAKPSQVPRAALGLVALALVVGGAALGLIPSVLAWAYLALSSLSYLVYLFDKAAAERGSRRTSENTLHTIDLLGGWPGALMAQQRFRHKTAKQSFQFVFWATVAVNLAGTYWLVSTGALSQLTQSLSG